MLVKSLLGSFILSAFLFSCNQQEKVERNIDSYTNVVLASSQAMIKWSTERTIHRMKERLSTPWARDSTLVYIPKADSAIAIGNIMTDYLDTLVGRITKSRKVEEDDSLFARLKMYENQVLKVDTNANKLFEEAVLFIDTTVDFKNINNKQFHNQFLNGIDKNRIVIFLNCLKQNVLNNELQMVHYFDLKCDISFEGYYREVPIIIQNSKHFKANDELEITAGIGAFSSHANPVFIINNKKLKIEPDGACRYKMRVLTELGKHIVPVKVSYFSPNGDRVVEIHKVVYYVE